MKTAYLRPKGTTVEVFKKLNLSYSSRASRNRIGCRENAQWRQLRFSEVGIFATTHIHATPRLRVALQFIGTYSRSAIVPIARRKRLQRAAALEKDRLRVALAPFWKNNIP
jgi:hypothetical protein